MTDEPGRVFRDAWIAGVREHFPGEPEAGCVAPWEETPEWERHAATAVAAQVRDFVEISGGNAVRLTREQKGRFVATCWIAQVHKHVASPEPSHVADWAELPAWRRETDADIFEALQG
ncbi:hypothetical protein [Streptomyces sp. NPDC049881]|uniref:hypothetical protein n=1 Tax=Streptomyces sp. NPDC049881 TaxID=3155778 RepID=UPI00343184D1